MSTLRFEVTGMTCGGCAGRATRALQGVEGVAEANVNLASRMATVDTDVSAEVLQAALKTAGYPAAESRIRLTIDGMSCASCVGRVEKALNALPGVIDARVNLTAQSAEVRALSGSVTAETLARIVTQAGYPATPVEGDDAPDTTERQAQEARALQRDTLIAGALTLPVFLGVMGGHLIPAIHHWIMGTFGQTAWWAAQFVLTSAVLIGPGRRFYRIGLPLLAKGTPDMNSLVALGTLAAWGYSTVALFAPALLPENAREVYFEAAAVIVTLILLGRWLEARAKGRTGVAIRHLLDLRPDSARVEREGVTQEIAAKDLQKGDVLQIRPGERIPTDGVVLTGRSFVEESMVTGEPAPVEKSEGAQVIGGTVNGAGALRIRAEAVGADTVLSRIVALVEQAQGAKLPIQALADRVVLWFVPAVLVIAVVTVIVWLALGPGVTHALVAGVSVLIIACPCAMGLATPVSIMVGTGRAAELGVLFRKGEALQRLEDVGVVAFDKTGTLTEGRPALVRTEALPGFDAETVLTLAASAEQGSEHPIARAMLQAAGSVEPAEDVQAIPGHGLRARVSGRDVLVGNARLMAQEGLDLSPLFATLNEMEQAAQTPVLVAIDRQLAGAFAVADRIKPGARQAIAALREAGVQVAMISGDARAVAQAIAADLGIEHVEAEVLPEGKVEAVRHLRDCFGAVAFVGDGINDAPALAEAEVGLAIGTGTDVAIESADVVLSSGAVAGAVNALYVSRRVMRNIRQNLVWAFGYNVALIPVAAGVLYPLTGLLLSPMLAAGAMALSSVFVLTNALRLRQLDHALAEEHGPVTQAQQEAPA